MALCAACYAYQILFDPPLTHYTLCPRNILYINEWYRVVTSNFFHGGLMHIGMNMMTTAAIGGMLEKRLGSLKYLFTVLWSIPLTCFIYISISWLLSSVFQYDDFIFQHSVGFSGILFHLSVLEANLIASDHHHSTRSVFGFFNVPVRAYPWAMLFLLSVMMPNISFMGHLSGILVGTLQSSQVLNWLFPADAFLRELEQSSSSRFITEKPGFIPMPPEAILSSYSVGGQGNDNSSLIASTCNICKIGFKFIRDVLETIKVCIFGYGPILPMRRNSSSNNVQEEEGEWEAVPRSRPAPVVEMV